MPKTTKINRNNKSSPTPKSLISKSITSKKSVNKRVKLALVAFVLFAVSFMGAYRFVTGGWFGAKAATLLNYNPYYSKCDPAARATLTLKEGSVDSASLTTGTCVKAIQRALNDCCGQGLVEDGIFGPKTKQSVVNFQNFFKDPNPDGVVDKELWNGIDYIHSVVVGNSGKKWVEPTKTYQDAVAARTAASAPSGGSTSSTPGTATGSTPSGGSTGSTSGTTSGTAPSGGSTSSTPGTATGSTPSGGSTGSGSASPTKCSAGYVYSPTSGCVLSTASSSPTKCLSGYTYIPYSGCIVNPNPGKKPSVKCADGYKLEGGICKVSITACNDGSRTAIALPSDIFAPNKVEHGCKIKSTGELVRCFSGYKLLDSSPKKCEKVQEDSLLDGIITPQYEKYLMPNYTEAVPCGYGTRNGFTVGVYKIGAVEYKGYPNLSSRACHTLPASATSKVGSTGSPIVKCLSGKPYVKKDGRASSYKCIN